MEVPNLTRKTSTRVTRLRIPLIAKLLSKTWELQSKGVKIYNFSAGQPGFQPPIELRKYLSQLLLQDFPQLYKYTPIEGIKELREAISDDLRETYGFEVDPESQIVITAGGEEALYLSLLVTVNEGEEVVLFDPTFLEYEPLVNLVCGKPVFVKTVEDKGYQPDIDDLTEKVGRKTKALILTSPDNPTGRIIGIEEAKAIADLAEDYGFWVFSDETYQFMIFEGEHIPMYRFENIRDKVGIIGSFSKDTGLSGWRIGYIYGSKELIGEVKKAKEYITLSTPSIAQYAVVYFLRNKLRNTYTKYIVNKYRKRRDVLYREIKEKLPEAKPFKPQAAFYMFVNMEAYMRKHGFKTGMELADYLLEKAYVATIPGEACGPSSLKHIRFSFSSINENDIVEAIDKISEIL